MYLRMPLPSIGLSIDDFREAAVLGQLANENDSDEEVLAKIQSMYEKIRESEQEDLTTSMSQGKTPEQVAFDDANYILDTVALTGGSWSEVRPKLAEIYMSVGRDDMASFVNPKSL